MAAGRAAKVSHAAAVPMKVTPVHSAGDIAEQVVKSVMSGGSSDEKKEEKSGGGFDPAALVSAATGNKDDGDGGFSVKNVLSSVSGDKKEEGGETTCALVIRGRSLSSQGQDSADRQDIRVQVYFLVYFPSANMEGGL